MIRTLKSLTLGTLQRAGVGSLVGGSAWRRRRLLILCYHGVALENEHEWCPDLYVSAGHLERRLELLRRNRCHVLPLGEAVSRLYRGDLPDRAVVLTFDDGYYDFLERAWPLLQAYDCPATVYLTTARVDHNLPNVNLLISYALWGSSRDHFESDGLPGLHGRYALGSQADRERLTQLVVEAVRARDVSETDRDAMARVVVERAGFDYEALVRRRILTLLRPAEVRDLAQRGVDFQLHTHLHRTPEDPEAFVRDVLVNQDRLRAMTGSVATHLCYPSGNYRPAYIPTLRRHGVETATTCDPGVATATCDPLTLPRFVDTSAVSDLVFESWVTGLAACLPRRTTHGGSNPGPYHLPTGHRRSRSFSEARGPA